MSMNQGTHRQKFWSDVPESIIITKIKLRSLGSAYKNDEAIVLTIDLAWARCGTSMFMAS